MKRISCVFKMNDDEMKGVSEKDKDVKSEIEMRNRKEN
jgi:hypothetical protein